MHFSSFYNCIKNRCKAITYNINAEEFDLITIFRKVPKEIKQNIIDLIKSLNWVYINKKAVSTTKPLLFIKWWFLYLLEQGSEINRTDIFGYNAIMSVILNENMTDEQKLDVIQMLIDKGCDVN